MQKKFLMNNKFKVSICVPAYEQPKNLQKCLESIEIQSFKDFEVIITDDSKSNDLKVVVDSFSNKLNIKYFKNTPSLGSPENWNESIRHATGKYIKILHHDDYFIYENSLEKMVKLLDENPNSKVLFCSSRHVDNSYTYHSSHILNLKNMQKVKDNPQILFLGNLIGAPSIMMYHRDINIYFDKRMKWLVDIDFYIRILTNNNFVYIKEELVNINIGEENRVTYICENDKNINIYEHMILLDKLELSFLPLSFKIYLLKIFFKFDINSVQELTQFGGLQYQNDLKKILFISKLLKPFFKVYKKLLYAIK